MLNEVIKEVTNNIIKRSLQSRKNYMDMVSSQEKLGRGRNILACSNLAHTVAAMTDNEKEQILFAQNANIGIILFNSSTCLSINYIFTIHTI